ncbi:putative membrane protein (TIGR02226 family) [Rhodobacter aestuarii]|uniref:N-terminal double-transmembrane domain-containing protein n=1 Tax=Rhodobacter aestuarii TaxID=453582 RepID=A0A1N7QDR9_9RHOB|nr:DUF4159 domain-containing protein [Rhodobacter aestuarii]PTV93600.1 putative membrane protein (TIGR02226 family) [Rhodobacter aestuarii]SIT21005.1 N-terminal double-transmembrane domain-containing protein [Rhodobacter aestuarii]
MMALGPLGFTAPWLLLGLAALPALWWLLRAVPPAPIKRRFPGVVLLLGLPDEETQAERTPWWLLALRMLALAAAIIGFAGPVLNPEPVQTARGPLLILVDGSWASARDWPRRVERMTRALDEAAAAGRPVALVNLSDPPPAPPPFAEAADLRRSLAGVKPQPWEPAIETAPESFLPEGNFDTLWLSDGLNRMGRGALLRAVTQRGMVKVWQPGTPVLALGAAAVEGTQLRVPLLASTPITQPLEVVAYGTDPSGAERELARVDVGVQADGTGEALVALPPELRNRISRFEIAGQRSAGAVSLTDDAQKRRKVALISGSTAREGLELLAPTHYLRQALAPSADLIEATLSDALLTKPDVIILADIGDVAEADRVAEWLEEGGLLIRFAGPRLAASDITNNSLLPVSLRQGGRSIGGTMSWGEPRRIAPFAEGSPFSGLVVPEEVTVREQVMAEPGPDLGAHTIAALADGTPLVTRSAFGQGEIVLFHVTANAEWSNLPLSGLFPQMLERLSVLARPVAPSAEDLAGQIFTPLKRLDGFGALSTTEAAAGVKGEDLAEGPPGPDLPPGLYGAEGRVLALNALPPGRQLAPATWPANVVLEAEGSARQTALQAPLLLAALLALLLDALATLSLSGRLRGARVAVLVALALGLAPIDSPAQEAMDEARAIAAADNVVLAYMPSGDAQMDDISNAGLRGLSQILTRRTTVEPSAPMAVDLESDDLALFTLIYWPINAASPSPSPAGYAKLNRFLRGGGMILFDTRDADLSGFGTATEAGQRLQALAAPLDIPPLAPLPADHVLTRAFYLLQTMPGRYDGPIWVEAAPLDAEQAEGMPFRNLNDGVTPVVIGGNDWAAAWAVGETGQPTFPVGRGSAGERQREIAYRFGVNLVMHVLTGNYKSDQVHVPALLERLGQ